MATAPSRLPSRFDEGRDYEALWKRLEQRLLDIRQNTADAICVENDVEKGRVLRGSWGAYGQIVNEMRQMLAEARGEPPSES